jgi:hypothetical protein
MEPLFRARRFHQHTAGTSLEIDAPARAGTSVHSATGFAVTPPKLLACPAPPTVTAACRYRVIRLARYIQNPAVASSRGRTASNTPQVNDADAEIVPLVKSIIPHTNLTVLLKIPS